MGGRDAGHRAGIGPGAPHVVEQMGARGQGGLGDRGLGGVDAQGRLGKGGRHGRDDRHDPGDLGPFVDWLVARTGALAADVEHVRAFRDHPPGLRHGPLHRIARVGRVATGQQPVPRKGVRGDVEDAHDERARAPGEDRRADAGRRRGGAELGRHRAGAPGSGSRRAGSSTRCARTAPTR